MTTDSLAPIHPGEILREEVLAPLDMTPYALAKACHVPRTRFERLGGVDHDQLAPCSSYEVRRKSLARPASLKDRLGVRILEALDH